MGTFFPLLTMFYHYQFRMKKSIELSLDWLKSSKYPSEARKSKLLHQSAKDMHDHRRSFCKCHSRWNDLSQGLTMNRQGPAVFR
jgi:hypothetical protein